MNRTVALLQDHEYAFVKDQPVSLTETEMRELSIPNEVRDRLLLLLWLQFWQPAVACLPVLAIQGRLTRGIQVSQARASFGISDT